MKILNSKYILSLLSTVCCGMLLASCIDDNLDGCPEDNPAVSEDGYALSFQISLPAMSRATSGWEENENYIDTDNLRILFFNAEQDTLIRSFTGRDLKFIPISSSADDGTAKWHVRIPISESKVDSIFADKLREDDFKIAVLANWDGSFSLNTGDPINKLHFITDDTTITGNAGRKAAYSFLMDENGKMGMNKSWYSNKTNYDFGDNSGNTNKTDNWIRENWDPSLDKNPALDYETLTADNTEYQYPELGEYSDPWLLWNFGGDANDNELKYKTFATKWEARNGSLLRNWFEGKDLDDLDESDPNYDSSYNPEIRIRTLNNTNGALEGDENYLTYTEIDGGKAVKTPEGGNNYYGIQLPKIKDEDLDDKKRVSLQSGGVFSFIARAVGNLYITAKGVNGKGELCIQRDMNEGPTKVAFESSEPSTSFTKINITGDQERIYIYNQGDIPVEIYQIEYLQGLHIFATSRRGKTLEENKIAMYGVQRFGALEEVWAKGTVFDLSNFTGQTPTTYEKSDIYLLRSVAKIELKIPKNLNAHHVYLRCANASARFDPVDVSTNTKDLWKDHDNNTASKDNCEFSHIRGHEPFFKESSSDIAATQFANYRKKLSWYYGKWADESGDIKDGNDKYKVAALDEYKSDRNSHPDYPQIMNPRILRSDFIEFIYMGSDDGTNDRYILYVGDKFVDDPNDVGENSKMETAIPKICHIEFRSKNNYYDDPFYNLDDNNCYRIYFTENGVSKKLTSDSYPDFSKEEETWEKKYEQKVEILKDHWPIIRNHVYSFTVKDLLETRYLDVDVKVLSWHQKDISVTW